MTWIKLDSREYKEGVKRGGLPNGLYYKGNPILIIYDNYYFFNILQFLDLIEYYYRDTWERELYDFKQNIHREIGIEEIREYIYSPNGEERVEIQNTTNEMRFPFVWTYEDVIRIYIPNKSEIWKLQKYIKKNPYFFPLLLQNIKDWTSFIHRYLEVPYLEEERLELWWGKYINNLGYIYHFEFKWLHFSPNTLLQLSLSLMKIIALNDWERERRDVKYSYELMNPISFHIYHYFLNSHALSTGEKIMVILLRIFIWIMEIIKEGENFYHYYLEESYLLFPKWGKLVNHFLSIKKYLMKNIPLFYKIINAIPFTIILYGRYILNIGSVAFFLKYYLGFRLLKIFFHWLFIIWKSFYPYVIKDEEEKIFSRYIFPIFTLFNLQILGLCFLFLQKNAPQYTYLGLILFILLRYIIVEKLLFGGIILRILKKEIDKENNYPPGEEREEYQKNLPWYKRYNKKHIKNLVDYLQF